MISIMRPFLHSSTRHFAKLSNPSIPISISLLLRSGMQRHTITRYRHAIKRQFVSTSIQTAPEVEMPSIQVQQLASQYAEKRNQSQTSLSQSASSSRDSSSEKLAELAEKAKFVFEEAWSTFEKLCGGRHSIRLPNEIIWLMGPPAAGKGTVTPALCKARQITNRPIVIGHLLKDPSARKFIDRGEMVSDQLVLELLLKQLMHCDPNSGVMVDGFPRTDVQVECLRLLYDRMNELRREFSSTSLSDKFRRPIFRITVLYVNEVESIKRQMKRGQQVREHNEMVRRTGQGNLLKERVTDSDENLIRARYKVFTHHFGALTRLKKLFPFHLINSDGPVDEVIRRVWSEFEYQSSLELEHDTLQTIENIPTADQIGIHARQELVRRLDRYQATRPERLKSVVNLIEKEFIPMIRRNAISGSSRIRLDENVFESTADIDILLDVMSERGFHVSVDRRKELTPIRVDPKMLEIISKEDISYVFEIRFQRNNIRGVFGSDDNEPKDLAGEVSATEALEVK